jgi:hypothetical protein
MLGVGAFRVAMRLVVRGGLACLCSGRSRSARGWRGVVVALMGKGRTGNEESETGEACDEAHEGSSLISLT